jgi:hypothetical protein
MSYETNRIFFSFVRVTMKDRLKVTFDTKQVTTTNILIGNCIEPIVLIYQGLLYTFIYTCIKYSNIGIQYRVIALTLFYVMFVFIFFCIRKE